MKKALLAGVLMLSGVAHAQDSNFQFKVEGRASGVSESKVCEGALKNALSNAQGICEEQGKQLGEYEVYGCAIEESLLGWQTRSHEVNFNCK